MIVAIITAKKAKEIKGKEYSSGMLFNPVQQGDKKWCISLPEAQHLNLEDIKEFVTYVPPIVEDEENQNT